MKRSMTRTVGLTLALATTATLLAQGTVDIGLFNTGNGTLEVKVRPTSDFDGVFSSVVFALRWDKNSDIALGTATVPDASPINTRRSGDVREEGMLAYQVYAGFGFDAMASSGMRWESGKEYTILTIPVTGKGAVELVNDGWTGTIANNADYYVSLGGMDKTGVIYKSLATTTDLDGTLTIKPNPNEGRFTFSFLSGEAKDVRIEVMNTLGQSLYTETLKGFEGSYVKEMDLTKMSEGIYYLKLTCGDRTNIHKIVYH